MYMYVCMYAAALSVGGPAFCLGLSLDSCIYAVYVDSYGFTADTD